MCRNAYCLASKQFFIAYLYSFRPAERNQEKQQRQTEKKKELKENGNKLSMKEKGKKGKQK